MLTVVLVDDAEDVVPEVEMRARWMRWSARIIQSQFPSAEN